MINIWAAHRWRVGIFVFAILTHYAMAATLILELVGIFPAGSATTTTPAAGMVSLLGAPGAAFGFLLAAVLAHVALVINGRATWWVRIALLLTQQSVMIITSLQIVAFILQGQYADGYPAPPAFILSDQIDGSLILGFLHTAALLHFITFLIVRGQGLTNQDAA